MVLKRSFAVSSSFTCPRCQHRISSASRTSSIRPKQRESSSSTKPLKYSRLSSRSLLRLQGRDAGRFLHDLLPAKLLGLPPELASQPIFTVFLNAQGRVLNDVFIYPPKTSTGAKEEQTWFVEVDRGGVGDLMRHLKKHKLRAKFTLREIDPEEGGVWSVWSDVGEEQELAGVGHDMLQLSVGGLDPRPMMGQRWLSTEQTSGEALQKTLVDLGDQTDEHEYTIRRMLNGIAEGPKEVLSASALPMESNVEFFGGIDFHKGCYVGQELTIRTHHTGVIRKRILPCQLYSDSEPLSHNQDAPRYHSQSSLALPAPGSNISKASSSRGRSVGKWLGGSGNIGLALCRLEPMTGIHLTEEAGQYDASEEFKIGIDAGPDGKLTSEVKVKPFVPLWLMQSIAGERDRRLRKSNRSTEEEDEDVES